MSDTYFPLEPSLWAATAVPAPATAPLDADAQADVVVVGAGYCGLSTALHLAEQGVHVRVLEAREIGFGGSGRNGGQVIPGLKYDPSELLAMFGPEQGQRLVDFAGGTADAVFDLIAKHRMDVPHVRQGWIQGAHTDEAVRLADRRVRDWSAQGVSATLLDRSEVAHAIGTDKYLGGWMDPRGGGVQPLSYVRELARAAIAAGAVVHTDSPVAQLAPQAGGGWRVHTARGPSVSADRVVLCTNGYTGALWPGLRTTIIAANSFQIATEPLSPALRAQILPGGQVTSDARNLLLYYRVDHTGRLLMGGRGTFDEPDPADRGKWGHLERVVAKLFPQAAGLAIDYRWCGHVAITRDYLPHLHEPAPGLLIDIGCQGRGVGLQTRMGQAIASYLVSRDPDVLPLAPTPIRPFPLHGLRRFYVGAVVAWYRMTDGGV